MSGRYTGSMHPHLNFITLGVEDLNRSLTFYRDGLGLVTQGIVGNELQDERTGAMGTIAFFELQGGLMLGLYERDNLAKDAGVSLGALDTTACSLGYNVRSKEEVDALLSRAEKAGASHTGSVHERPWGVYSGYFKDPDGHLWEIAWNPSIATTE